MRRRDVGIFDWAFWLQWVLATTLGWVAGGFFVAGIAYLVTGFAVGAAQWAILYQRIPKAWRWFLASGFGWFAGSWVVILFLPAEFDILAGLISGLGIGIAQWLVLREEVNWAGWWILINGIGWFTGISIFPGAILTGVLAGVISGIALIILLHSPREGDTNV